MNVGFLAFSKGIAYYVLERYRKSGFNFRSVLIIGSRERAKETIETIGDQIGSGFRVIGCLDVDPADIGKSVSNGIEVFGTIDQLEKILREQVVDEVIFAMPLKRIENADQYIDKAETMGISVRIVPDWQIHALMYRPGNAEPIRSLAQRRSLYITKTQTLFYPFQPVRLSLLGWRAGPRFTRRQCGGLLWVNFIIDPG